MKIWYDFKNSHEPAFYEHFATIYHESKGVKRKPLCKKPIILNDRRIKHPKGAEKYTLHYYILSKKPMSEKNLVRATLSLYNNLWIDYIGIELSEVCRVNG